MGHNLWEAYNRMEKVEHAAWTVWLARQLGQARTLPVEEVAKLTRLGINKGYRPPLTTSLTDKTDSDRYDTSVLGKVK
jgi:ribulose-5-phosphate 4-epimerase/fuculose-1-phosphate aldolase